tara:strand:- start:351 stop:494 length:144 start_codon:yes stop_codon:yes gene_type:complete
MTKTSKWLSILLKGMGDAIFHPFKNNPPPEIGYQPFNDLPYKSKGIA